jgi:hypothetical protein
MRISKPCWLSSYAGLRFAPLPAVFIEYRFALKKSAADLAYQATFAYYPRIIS